MDPAVSHPPVGITAMHRTAVGDAMHPGIMACSPITPIEEVAQIMAGGRVHCVTVLEHANDHSPVVSGVVSDIDLLTWATGGDTHLPVGGDVREPAVSVSPDATVHEAAQLMAAPGVGHLVVVDPRRRTPVGILSALDVARVLASTVTERFTGERRAR